MEDLFFKTLVMHCAQGLLAHSNPDNKFINTPGKKKEEHLADQAFAYADLIMKRFEERASLENEKKIHEPDVR